MQIELLIVITSIIVGFVILWLLIKKELGKLSEQSNDQMLLEWLKSMQRTIDTTNKTLNETMRGSNKDMTKTLQENTRQLNDRLDSAARVMGDLQRHVGEMSEVGRGIKSLQEFLQSPKLRGNIGEQVLRDMIGQTFPKHAFHLQYSFKSGVKVDAVLKTDAGLLCIDSKFPMEQFQLMHRGKTDEDRKKAKKQFVIDVKKHINDISKKYILPEEGTMDFALMYIPSESVYYEIATMTELMSFAQKQRIYPVSPNTLYAHLQVLLVSFAGKELQQRSQEVLKLLRAMKKDYEKTNEHIGVLGKHIHNAFNSMNTVSGAFTILGQKITRAQELPGEKDQLELN
ncbi:DNA recombination protein RmuC [Patescibacteria group bacterium]